jgi:hypothetical protein
MTKLLRFQNDQLGLTKQGLKFTIIKQDTMWIVHYAWEKSFARIETNMHVIAERGWGPLNYVLLDHPELKAIEDRVSLVTLRDYGNGTSDKKSELLEHH